MSNSFITFLKEQIDAQQQSIQRLSSFVAVVNSNVGSIDETNDETNVTQLESILQNVGER